MESNRTSGALRYRWRRVAILVCVLGVLAGCMKRTGTTPSRGGPLRALDPLTAAETREAEQIARADSRVTQLLGTGRARLVFVDFIAIKPATLEASRDPDRLTLDRTAEVVFYRFDNDSGARVIVNVGRKSLISAERMEGIDVPLNREDLAEAVQLALRNDQTRQLLGADVARFERLEVAKSNAALRDQNAVRGLRVVPVDANDPCAGKRCVQLLFQKDGGYLLDTVIVDLTGQSVRILKGDNEDHNH